MTVLVDTNVLLRMCQPGHPQRQPAIASLSVLRSRGHTLCLVSQNLYEFWVVATRPQGVNGLGRTAGQAAGLLNQLLMQFRLLPDSNSVLPNWQQLVLTYNVVGKKAHDARLVVAMRSHGIDNLLTFNDADFHRFGHHVYTPDQVIASPP